MKLKGFDSVVPLGAPCFLSFKLEDSELGTLPVPTQLTIKGRSSIIEASKKRGFTTLSWKESEISISRTPIIADISSNQYLEKSLKITLHVMGTHANPPAVCLP